jgi:Flp pilus assembly protein TadD
MRATRNLIIAVTAITAAGCGNSGKQGGTEKSGARVVEAQQETQASGDTVAASTGSIQVTPAPVAASGKAKGEASGEECKHEVDPAWASAKSLLEAKKYAEAAVELEKITAANPDKGGGWQMLGYALHASGDLDRAMVAHKKAATFEDQRAVALYNIACVHALDGDRDAAFASLDKAIAAGFYKTKYLEEDSDLASLRSDARFAARVKMASANVAAGEKEMAAKMAAKKASKDGHDCEAKKAAAW